MKKTIATTPRIFPTPYAVVDFNPAMALFDPAKSDAFFAYITQRPKLIYGRDTKKATLLDHVMKQVTPENYDAIFPAIRRLLIEGSHEACDTEILFGGMENNILPHQRLILDRGAYLQAHYLSAGGYGARPLYVQNIAIRFLELIKGQSEHDALANSLRSGFRWAVQQHPKCPSLTSLAVGRIYRDIDFTKPVLITGGSPGHFQTLIVHEKSQTFFCTACDGTDGPRVFQEFFDPNLPKIPPFHRLMSVSFTVPGARLDFRAVLREFTLHQSDGLKTIFDRVKSFAVFDRPKVYRLSPGHAFGSRECGFSNVLLGIQLLISDGTVLDDHPLLQALPEFLGQVMKRDYALTDQDLEAIRRNWHDRSLEFVEHLFMLGNASNAIKWDFDNGIQDSAEKKFSFLMDRIRKINERPLFLQRRRSQSDLKQLLSQMEMFKPKSPFYKTVMEWRDRFPNVASVGEIDTLFDEIYKSVTEAQV